MSYFDHTIGTPLPRSPVNNWCMHRFPEIIVHAPLPLNGCTIHQNIRNVQCFPLVRFCWSNAMQCYRLFEIEISFSRKRNTAIIIGAFEHILSSTEHVLKGKHRFSFSLFTIFWQLQSFISRLHFNCIA